MDPAMSPERPSEPPPLPPAALLRGSGRPRSGPWGRALRRLLLATPVGSLVAVTAIAVGAPSRLSPCPAAEQFVTWDGVER